MEAVGQLAAGVAHDFNNILTVIQGHLSLQLATQEFAENTRSALSETLNASERAATLTRQLLAFSRKQIVDPRVLDLNTLLSDLQKMLGRLIGEDIDLAIQLGEDVGPVRIDSGQIEQVVLNLCANARDAMPDGGLLRIETGNAEVGVATTVIDEPMPAGSYVTLTVSDGGHGMDKETLARVFEPFFTTKPPGEGTGLGLATTYGIVKQAGGFVSARSEPGQGATFTVYLPRVDEPVPSPTAVGDSPAQRGSETILLVEDEDSLRAMACEILAAQGYRVIEAATAKAAVARAADCRPLDLLLTDVIMPGGNGHALAQTLNALRPELKVLYMSGYTDDIIAQRGVLESGVRLLQKPFTAKALLESVRAALDGVEVGGPT
jgi:CheY-like chemotaxis protein